MNLTELLVTRENVDEISEKFGLTEQQTLDAMAAIIPAFSEGLRRNAGSPQGAASLIKALASGRHAQYAQNPASATTPFGVNDGKAILGHLFGNKDVSRAVASQASHATGIGTTVLKSLLPTLASMVMGALFKGATGGGLGGALGKALGGAAGGGLLGKIIEGVADGMLGGAKQAMPRRRAPARRSTNGGSLEDLLGQVLGSGSASTRAPRQRRSTSGGMGDILGQVLGGGRQRPPRTAPMPPQRRRGGGLNEIFGDMLEPGGNTSREYQRQTGNVFDELLGS